MQQIATTVYFSGQDIFPKTMKTATKRNNFPSVLQGRYHCQCFIIKNSNSASFGKLWAIILSLTHFFIPYSTSVMRILITILGLSAILGLQSCSEDFTVAAPYRQITVVSGILDRDDPAHYIRIQKAFMDENKSAIDMSKQPDSSFFSNLEVKLYQYNIEQTKILDSVTLSRVDMNNEPGDYRKYDAVNNQQFFTTPNYAYKFTNDGWTKPHVLSPAHWYRLLITNLDNNNRDTSNFVGIVNSDEERANDGFFIPDFDQAAYSLNFAKTANNGRFRLLTYMPRNGRKVEGYIHFNYTEKDAATLQETKKKVVYAFDAEEGENVVNFELIALNSSIFAFLNSSIGPAPANVERYMDSCDVFVYAASPEMHYYTTINQGQAGGLTGDNIRPNYTNFSGSNVIGVLGSRAKRIKWSVPIEKSTIDSLMSNPITAPLRIRTR